MKIISNKEYEELILYKRKCLYYRAVLDKIKIIVFDYRNKDIFKSKDKNIYTAMRDIINIFFDFNKNYNRIQYGIENIQKYINNQKRRRKC